MTRMLDAWHDRYHVKDVQESIQAWRARGGHSDLNCPYCQDEFIDTCRAEYATQFPMPVVEMDGEIERGDWTEATYHDRMEDLEI